jgi:hypothetical protein
MEWVVREEVVQGGEMTQALYAHMNNKIKESERRKTYRRCRK